MKFCEKKIMIKRFFYLYTAFPEKLQSDFFLPS